MESWVESWGRGGILGTSLTNYTNSVIDLVLFRSITPSNSHPRFVQFVKDVALKIASLSLAMTPTIGIFK